MRRSRSSTWRRHLDVSVLEVEEGVIEVKSTNGDTTFLGGDWDQRIIAWRGR
ncbi:Hsp70 family protein [Candidatus Amarobacter glycogenicus]|uniref:Hsp70 family protein n=1 Tax=Candidatus Amarobacter glycogenicus TaxID=3140699 RepID=UPI002A0FC3C2|nr:Hsp70 family protein [Dehalococcoidia bacterium]